MPAPSRLLGSGRSKVRTLTISSSSGLKEYFSQFRLKGDCKYCFENQSSVMPIGEISVVKSGSGMFFTE